MGKVVKKESRGKASASKENKKKNDNIKGDIFRLSKKARALGVFDGRIEADAEEAVPVISRLKELFLEQSSRRIFHAEKELRRSLKRAKDAEIAKSARTLKTGASEAGSAEKLQDNHESLKSLDIESAAKTISEAVVKAHDENKASADAEAEKNEPEDGNSKNNSKHDDGEDGEEKEKINNAKDSNADEGGESSMDVEYTAPKSTAKRAKVVNPRSVVSTTFPKKTPARRVAAHKSVIESLELLIEALTERDTAILARAMSVLGISSNDLGRGNGGDGDSDDDDYNARHGTGDPFDPDASDGADDLEAQWDAELEGIGAPHAKKRKNRPGQMARRALAEQKHGREARHVKDPALRIAMEERLAKRQEKGKRKGKGKAPRWTPYGPARESMPRGGSNLIEIGGDGGVNRAGPPPGVVQRKSASGPPEHLHPSWEAKRKQAEAAANGFSGTKITFD